MCECGVRQSLNNLTSDDGFAGFIDRCPGVLSFFINGRSHLNGSGMKMSSFCEMLQDLPLSFVPSLTDSGLALVVNNATHLPSLSLLIKYRKCVGPRSIADVWNGPQNLA
jgi:hypothetical protein